MCTSIACIQTLLEWYLIIISWLVILKFAFVHKWVSKSLKWNKNHFNVQNSIRGDEIIRMEQIICSVTKQYFQWDKITQEHKN